jgi:hypothetical protein
VAETDFERIKVANGGVRSDTVYVISHVRKAES